MSNQTRTLPIVTLALVAALVLVFSLFVLEKSKNYQHSSIITTNNGEQQQFNWRLVTSWPKNFPGLGNAPENFARIVKEMSNGRLNIKVYGAGEIVPALGVFDAVSSGSVEMGHSSAYYWKGKIPAAQFFTSVPFGMNAKEINGWLRYGGGMELWRELYEPFNVIPFAMGNTGVQMGGWFNREINSMEDIKGLKMRIPGMGGEVLTRAGGTAVTIAGAELYSSMQTGVIDATEWVGPYNDVAFGLHEVAKYYYYPGWHEPGPALELSVNQLAFESLPADLQAIVATAAQAINQDMLDEYTARDNERLQQILEDPEIEIRRFPDDVISTFREVALEIYEETAAEDPEFSRVYNAYENFSKKVRAYHQLSEEAYYETR